MGTEKEQSGTGAFPGEMVDEIVSRDSDVVGLLFHGVRGQIVQLLIKEDLTLRQLSDILKINPGTTKRHLEELLEKKIIFMSKSIQNQFGITMKYYRAAAKRFRIELEFPRDSAENLAKFETPPPQKH